MNAMCRAISGACLAAAVLLGGANAGAVEVASVKLEDNVRSDAGELVLNGAGLRTKFVFKVYVAALYLPQKERSAAAILQGDGPRRVVLHMLRNVEGESLHEALDEGLRNNLPAAALDALKTPLARLGQVFRAIGEAKEGDLIQLDISTAGLAVTVNGRVRDQIASEALGRALLRVWLGDKPADGALKNALLGK